MSKHILYTLIGLIFGNGIGHSSNLLEQISDKHFEACATVIKEILNYRRTECKDLRTALGFRTFVCPDALLIGVKPENNAVQSFYSPFGQVDFEMKSLTAAGKELVEIWSGFSIAKNLIFLLSNLEIKVEQVSERINVYDFLGGESKLLGGWSWKENYQSKGSYGSLYRITSLNGRELPLSPQEIRVLKVVVTDEAHDKPTHKFKKHFAGKINGYSKF
jgi:hypothetical protein